MSAAKVASRKAISVAAKQGMRAGKIVGRKTIKVATTHGTKFAKKAAKKELKKRQNMVLKLLFMVSMHYHNQL